MFTAIMTVDMSQTWHKEGWMRRSSNRVTEDKLLVGTEKWMTVEIDKGPEHPEHGYFRDVRSFHTVCTCR